MAKTLKEFTTRIRDLKLENRLRPLKNPPDLLMPDLLMMVVEFASFPPMEMRVTLPEAQEWESIAKNARPVKITIAVDDTEDSA